MGWRIKSFKIWCSRKCLFDDRDQTFCTSPERVSEQFSNQFLFGQVDFGVVLFKILTLGRKSDFGGSRSFGEVGRRLRGWRSNKLHRFLEWLSCYRAELETLGSGRFGPELESEKAEYSRVLNEQNTFFRFLVVSSFGPSCIHATGWMLRKTVGGGQEARSRIGVHKKVFLMIETKTCVLHRNVFLKSLATSFCLPGSILELFCSKS